MIIDHSVDGFFIHRVRTLEHGIEIRAKSGWPVSSQTRLTRSDTRLCRRGPANQKPIPTRMPIAEVIHIKADVASPRTVSPSLEAGLKAASCASGVDDALTTPSTFTEPVSGHSPPSAA